MYWITEAQVASFSRLSIECNDKQYWLIHEVIREIKLAFKCVYASPIVSNNQRNIRASPFHLSKPFYEDDMMMMSYDDVWSRWVMRLRLRERVGRLCLNCHYAALIINDNQRSNRLYHITIYQINPAITTHDLKDDILLYILHAPVIGITNRRSIGYQRKSSFKSSVDHIWGEQ